MAAMPECRARAAKAQSLALTGLGPPAVWAARAVLRAMGLLARPALRVVLAALVALAERAATVVLGARAAQEALVAGPSEVLMWLLREAQAAGEAQAARAARFRAMAVMAATVA